MRQAAAIMNISMALALPLGGCTFTPSASSFSRNEADTVMSVQFGTVIALREVERRRHKAPSQSFPQGGLADEAARTPLDLDCARRARAVSRMRIGSKLWLPKR